MSWKKLENLEQLSEIKELSKTRPVLIFKHSSRCSISSMAWNRMERSWKMEDNEKVTAYFLDLIANRDISNAVTKEFSIEHASPQVILIKNGETVYENSHMGINYTEILEHSRCSKKQ